MDCLGRSCWQRRRAGRGTGRPARRSTFSWRSGGRLLLFFRTERQGRLAVSCGPGWRLRFHAKRKGGQAIGNKQFCERPISHPNDLKDLRPASRNRSFRSAKGILRFCWFFRLVETQNARERNQRRIRARAAELRESATRNRRRKPLESLKTDCMRRFAPT